MKFQSALVVFALLVTSRAFSYAEFVGYGYSSCLTCHFNGHGGGALNDYGRALWSGEIASRSLYSATRSDEDLGESSGFLGRTELPWWLRPGMKYRELWNKSDYGSSNAREQKIYMQADVNLVLKFDQDERYLFYFTEGYRPNSNIDSTKNLNRWLGREYWFRLQIGETYWVYLGQLDKVFGIRSIDHTSYARAYQKLRQYDQTQGLVLHKVEANWEIAAQYFVGNTDEAKDSRQKGQSLLLDFDVGDKKRLSLSYLSSKSDLDGLGLYALSWRGALSKGSSLLAEYGIREATTTGLTAKKTGSWISVQSFLQMTRGYNFHTVVERYNEEFKPSVPDNWRWGFGFIMFPAPRFELRTDLISKRDVKETGGENDRWTLQGQLHVSL